MTCQGTKVARVSLFNIVRNKELLAYSGDEYFVLADVVDSLGYKQNEKLSDVSCLTCARTLARIYGTFYQTPLVFRRPAAFLRMFDRPH